MPKTREYPHFFICLLVHPILTCGYLKQFLFGGNLWSSACIVAEMIVPQGILDVSHKSFLYGLWRMPFGAKDKRQDLTTSFHFKESITIVHDKIPLPLFWGLSKIISE